MFVLFASTPWLFSLRVTLGLEVPEGCWAVLVQNKEMRRYTPGPRYGSRPRGEAGITAQYLEAMDNDDGLGGDSDDADGLTATERARNALRRNAAVSSLFCHCHGH
jgi:hypothetical protein